MSTKENTNLIYILSDEDYGYSKLLMATQNLENICRVAEDKFLSQNIQFDCLDYRHEWLIRVFKSGLPFMDIYLLDLLAENKNITTWQELYNVVTAKVESSIGDFQ